MGFLERWDRRNSAILAEQNQDTKGPDWATKSKGSRRGAIGAATALAAVRLRGRCQCGAAVAAFPAGVTRDVTTSSLDPSAHAGCREGAALTRPRIPSGRGFVLSTTANQRRRSPMR